MCLFQRFQFCIFTICIIASVIFLQCRSFLVYFQTGKILCYNIFLVSNLQLIASAFIHNFFITKVKFQTDSNATALIILRQSSLKSQISSGCRRICFHITEKLTILAISLIQLHSTCTISDLVRKQRCQRSNFTAWRRILLIYGVNRCTEYDFSSSNIEITIFLRRTDGWSFRKILVSDSIHRCSRRRNIQWKYIPINPDFPLGNFRISLGFISTSIWFLFTYTTDLQPNATKTILNHPIIKIAHCIQRISVAAASLLQRINLTFRQRSGSILGKNIHRYLWRKTSIPWIIIPTAILVFYVNLHISQRNSIIIITS